MVSAKEFKKMRNERNAYKLAYYELDCYFDSISDEEQIKVGIRIEKIFNKMKQKNDKINLT
jgi:hypothetical protein